MKYQKENAFFDSDFINSYVKTGRNIELLQKYQCLNAEGREKLAAYLEDLLCNPENIFELKF